MTKNILLAGVSAAALVLATTAAFAEGSGNSSTSTNGSAATSVANDGSTIGNGNSSSNASFEGTFTHTDNSTTAANTAEFKNNAAVTASVLDGTIAASNVQYHPGAGDSYQGNDVTGSAFNGASCIIAVNQNTGINANNQQAITVSVGAVNVQ